MKKSLFSALFLGVFISLPQFVSAGLLDRDQFTVKINNNVENTKMVLFEKKGNQAVRPDVFNILDPNSQQISKKLWALTGETFVTDAKFPLFGKLPLLQDPEDTIELEVKVFDDLPGMEPTLRDYQGVVPIIIRPRYQYQRSGSPVSGQISIGIGTSGVRSYGPGGFQYMNRAGRWGSGASIAGNSCRTWSDDAETIITINAECVEWTTNRKTARRW